FDPVEFPVALVGGRVIGEHVVRTVVAHNALECRREIVAVYGRKTAAFFRQLAKALLGEAQLVGEPALPDATTGDGVVAVRELSDADGVVGAIGQPTRV